MNKVYIYVHSKLLMAHGVQVIVQQIERKIKEATVVNSLKDVPKGAIVIPYGVLESVELIKKKKDYPLVLSMLVDAYSLGESSKLVCFWNKPYIAFSQKLRGALKYVKFTLYEWLILRYYNHVVLVSWGDKYYYSRKLSTRRYAEKITVIPNGIIPWEGNRIYRRKNNHKLIIGCLSPWDESAFATLQLFLNEIWAKLNTRNNLKLIIAGRYLTEDKKNYILGFENIEVMGEVKDLSEFYDAIDVSLLTMVKRCGIINRLLDAFSYQVPVLTRPQSLLAFKEKLDCCYVYNDVNTFERMVANILNNPLMVQKKVNDARDVILRNNDWEKNYSSFNELLM